MKMINPASQSQHDEGMVALLSNSFSGELLATVTKLLGQMYQDANAHLDATRWLDGVELTADRLGLICSNDLGEAVNAMKNNAYAVGKIELNEKIRELVVYSVSPQYIELRFALGIAQQ